MLYKRLRRNQSLKQEILTAAKSRIKKESVIIIDEMLEVIPCPKS